MAFGEGEFVHLLGQMAKQSPYAHFLLPSVLGPGMNAKGRAARRGRSPGPFGAGESVASAASRAAALGAALRALQGVHGLVWGAVHRVSTVGKGGGIPLRAGRDATGEAVEQRLFPPSRKPRRRQAAFGGRA